MIVAVTDNLVRENQLRTMFAESMSAMYGTEVGLYLDLVRITEESNAACIDKRIKQLTASGDLNEAQARIELEKEVGPLDRVNGERHGAIRIASCKELKSIADIYRVMGMFPVDFYNLGATGGSAPVIATAGRPLDLETKPGEKVTSPFRLFTSVLDIEALDWKELSEAKKKFFIDKMGGNERRAKKEVRRIQDRMRELVEDRAIFPVSLDGDERTNDLTKSRLGELMVKFAKEKALSQEEAKEFVGLTTKIFEMSNKLVVDLKDYKDIRQLSEVAADIIGFPNPHINHLTPRALDIEDVYKRMEAEGKEKHFRMLSRIEGPPTTMVPKVLLNQTSYISKPTWVFTNGDDIQMLEEKKVLEALKSALEAKGIMLKYSGNLDLAKFGLALDNAGYNLTEIFGKKNVSDFSLKDAVRELVKKTDCTIDIESIPEITIVAHTARFGEIEQRGIALTRDGRQKYDAALDKAEEAFAKYLDNFGSEKEKHRNNEEFQRVAEQFFKESGLWAPEGAKDPYRHLIDNEYAHFTYHLGDTSKLDVSLIAKVRAAIEKGGDNVYLPGIIQELVDAGMVIRKPVVYEDFLPKSAGGIFLGNQQLAAREAKVSSAGTQAMASDPKFKRFGDAGVNVHVSYNLFAAAEANSVKNVLGMLHQLGNIGSIPENVNKLLEKRIGQELEYMQYVPESPPTKFDAARGAFMDFVHKAMAEIRQRLN